ncbi:MAG: redoxin domain-containing protein [Fuerstiella sp.]|nr:redoxin domain-containing protein [Fuerstiella sp.]MCP4858856.1 redoxin domain-containing protein [Fuerstiella sp.]
MRQLVQLQKQADEFKALNTEMIFVFREEKSGVDGLKKIMDGTKTDFTLTLDLDKQSTNVYSTKEMTFDNFVIDRKGIVQAIIDGTLRDRATADELLKVLRKIEG